MKSRKQKEELALAMLAAKYNADGTPFLVTGEMDDAHISLVQQMWDTYGEINMIEYFAEEFVKGEKWYRDNFGPENECIIMLNKYYDLLALGLVKDWRKKKTKKAEPDITRSRKRKKQ